MKVEYSCGCKCVVKGRVMKLDEKYCDNHGPKLAKSQFIAKLHADAEDLERKALSEWAVKNTAKAHQLMDTARCLRIAANFVDGVQAA